MKRINILNLLIAFLLIGAISCTKETIETATTETEATTSGTTTVVEHQLDSTLVSFTIQLLPGQSAILSNTKSTASMENADVTITYSGVSQTLKADASGRATFTEVPQGDVSVRIVKANYSTVSFISSFLSGSSNEHLEAACQVIMIPTAVDLTTLSGTCYLQSDVRVTFNAWSTFNSSFVQDMDLENLPANSKVYASVLPESLNNLISLNYNGGISSVAYEDLSFEAVVNASGEYELSLPKVAGGLFYSISFDDLKTDVIYSARQIDTATGDYVYDTNNNLSLIDKSENHIFEASSFEIQVGKSAKIQDANFYYYGELNDDLYFGSIY